MSNPFDQFDAAQAPKARRPAVPPAVAPDDAELYAEDLRASEVQSFAAEPNPFDQFEEEAASPPIAPQQVAQPAAPKRQRNIYGEVAGFMANVNRGLGVADEMAAAGGTVVNALTGRGPQGWSANMAAQRGLEDDFRADRPQTAALALGTGNALTMAAPAGPGAAAFANGGRAINALRGATVAGLSGAGYSAADRGSLAERAGATAEAAYDPLTLALGSGVGAIAGRGRPRAERAPAPSLDELRTQKNEAYRAVDASGERYAPEQFTGLVDNIVGEMRAARFNPRLQQKAAIMLDELSNLSNQAAGHSPTLSELDDLRQVIGRDVSSSPDPGERRMGEIMREQIDAFIDEAGDSEAIRHARDLNTRVRKIEKLDDLDEAAADRAAASGSGGNVNNATRQNAIRFKNQVKNLTPAEQAATQRVIDGTPRGNALRQVGKLSPEGNGLMLGGHLLASGATGGVSNIAAGAGFVAKRAADAITRRNVDELRDLIARGGREAAQEIDQQLIRSGADDLRQQLANDLSVAAGVQGGGQRGAVEVYFPDHPERGVFSSSR